MSKKNLLVSKKFVILLLFHFDNAKIIQIFEHTKYFSNFFQKNFMLYNIISNNFLIFKCLWTQINFLNF